MNRNLLILSILLIISFNAFSQKAGEYYNKGLIAFKNNLADEALLYHDSSVNLKNDEYISYQLRGYIKFTQGKFNDAIINFNKAIELNPNDADNFGKRAVARDSTKDAQGALEDLNRAIIIDPSQGIFYRDRANLHLKLGDTVLALSDFDNDIKLIKKDDPMFYWDHYARGKTRFFTRDYKGCIEDCDVIIADINALSDKSVIELAYEYRAGSNLKLTKYLEAISDCDNFLKYSQKDYSIYLTKGEAYFLLNDFSNCIKTLDQSIKIHPAANSYFYRSMANNKLNLLKESENDLTKAIILDPNFLIAYKNRALVRGVLGNYKGVISDANVVLKEEPANVDILAIKGVALYSLNNKKEGCPIIKRSANLGNQRAKQFAKEKCK